MKNLFGAEIKSNKCLRCGKKKALHRITRICLKCSEIPHGVYCASWGCKECMKEQGKRVKEIGKK